MRCGAVRCCAVGRGGKGCGVMVGVRVARWHSVTWSGTHADHSQPSPVSPLQYSTVYCKLNCVSRWLAGWLVRALPQPLLLLLLLLLLLRPALHLVPFFLSFLLFSLASQPIQFSPHRRAFHGTQHTVLHCTVKYDTAWLQVQRAGKRNTSFRTSRVALASSDLRASCAATQSAPS